MMRIATTTEDFAIFYEDYIDLIKCVAKNGFRYIDLSLYIVHKNDPLLIRDDWRDMTEKIKEATRSLGVQLVQSHSPGGAIFAPDHSFNETLFERHIRSIEVCGELGIRNIVVHSGLWPRMTKQEFFENNKRFFDLLLNRTADSGVNVLIENDTAGDLNRGYALTTGKEMREFIEYMNVPRIHVCWDTGHANTFGLQHQHLIDLGEELYALHVNDNLEDNDDHIVPYMGTLNLDDVMHGLITAQYNGYFTFEACRLLRPKITWFSKRRPFETDTRLADPTVEMYSAMEKLMYSIGEYALKSYDCFEE